MLGTYGIKKPADCSPSDMEAIITYKETRDSELSPTIQKLNGEQILTQLLHNDTTGGNTNEPLGGLYNLNLPTNLFNQVGIYNIYIKPIEIRTKILDCGNLAASPEVKGLIFDVSNVPSRFINKFVNGGLVGYRIEYFDNGVKRQNFFRIITSCFLCEPVNLNLTNTNQKAVRYRYTDSGTLLFCTISPSSAPSNKTNAIPFIGLANQDVLLTNSFFNPLNLEIEIVDYDMESIAVTLLGNQSKSIESDGGGIYTIYDFNNNIYKQYDLYEIKDQFDQPLYEIRRMRTTIDESKDIGTISEP